MEKPDVSKPVFQLMNPAVIQRIKDSKCPICNKAIREADFRESLSIKEYTSHGLCQDCQDDAWLKS